MRWEGVFATTSSSGRDQAMADNALWFANQAPANSRLILWAHDGHVGRLPGTMGQYIADAFGSAYVPIALQFNRGTFNAITQNGTSFGSLAAQTVGVSVNGYVDAAFRTVSAAAFFVDLVNETVYKPSLREVVGKLKVHGLVPFADAVIFVQNMSATVLLPFVTK